MRTHMFCPDCNKAMNCNEVLKLFRGYAVRTNELTACACCFASHMSGQTLAESILYDFCCRDCAGSVGTGRLEEMLEELRLHPPDPGSIGVAFQAPWTIWRMAVGDRYYTLDAVTNLWAVSIYGREAGAPAAPTSIILKPGQKRCGCNNCERLRVQEA